MKSSTSYVNELYAAIYGIVHSPQAFYWLMRYKFGVEDERGKQFRIGYAENSNQPKTSESQLAEATIYVALIVLMSLGYLADEVVFDVLAGMLAFGLGVEWLWKVEVSGVA